jgi:hypothetical protein
MNLSPDIDLGKSLRQLFGNDRESEARIKDDQARQEKTTHAILQRFVAANASERRELTILADEVGLGKTYVALAAAVSLLDAIRRGDSPEGLPSNKPVALVLTPSNDALFNKWRREADAFKKDCARSIGALDWLEIRSPIPGTSKAGNMVDLAIQMRDATRRRPMLLIAKQGVIGARLKDCDWWRRRALAAVFEFCRVHIDDRKWCCSKILGTSAKSSVAELLDLRRSPGMWKEESDACTNVHAAFQRVLEDDRIRPRIDRHLADRKARQLQDDLDDLTRLAIVGELPRLPLVIIDEVHNLKNECVQARRHFETFFRERICRILGLSATPFQLRQGELLSILKLRNTLGLPRERREALDSAVEELSEAMEASRKSGDDFRCRWSALLSRDQAVIEETWQAVSNAAPAERIKMASQIRPQRLSRAMVAALNLEQLNSKLQGHLHPFVIRHQHPRGNREHFVGRHAEVGQENGSLHFSWAPGLEVRGDEELAHYVMMRAVALAKDEKGLPGLGAELTGSYRHLVETSAVWKRLADGSNPLLKEYRAVLNGMIGHRTDEHDPDREHRKIQATARRVLDFFKRGQKSLVFCVFTKTAEAIRDQIQLELDSYLNETKKRLFGEGTAFENFRNRFFNRREPLFSLIQDHPLLGQVGVGESGIPQSLRLTEHHLNDVAGWLVRKGELAAVEKPDRRLLLAATEHVAVRALKETPCGRNWLRCVLAAWSNKESEPWSTIAEQSWLDAREPLSRSERAGRVRQNQALEARSGDNDPLQLEDSEETGPGTAGSGSGKCEVTAWIERLREDTIGEIVAPYFQQRIIRHQAGRLPLLVEHHSDLLAKLNLATRAVAGQVFRRILMADDFLLRYLADVERDNAERWADYLSDRYVKRLHGHSETLKDRFHAYLETLARANGSELLLNGYRDAAENRNVVQLVKGSTEDRDRYFLGFNTPYRPEVLISTSVGQEGIDLHRECRHIIHHDLCWNPATIEQRTGRVDRIGSKVERERLGEKVEKLPTLEIVVPYLAATYDERMFEELYRRAQLFEVTLGGDMRIENRGEVGEVESETLKREEDGNGAEGEDLGKESSDAGVVNLPRDMVQRLRVDLSVRKPAFVEAADSQR